MVAPDRAREVDGEGLGRLVDGVVQERARGSSHVVTPGANVRVPLVADVVAAGEGRAVGGGVVHGQRHGAGVESETVKKPLGLGPEAEDLAGVRSWPPDTHVQIAVGAEGQPAQIGHAAAAGRT